MRIGIRKIGMRLRQPRRLDDAHGAAHLMRLAFEFRGEHRGRHQRRRQLHRLHRAFARQIAVDLFQLQRARGEQHAALAAVGRLVDQAGGEIVVEDRQRAAPVAPGAAEAEHGMRGPGRRRRNLQRLIRDHHGRDRIVGALRLDEQAAQAEQARIVALGHGAEGALRALAIAFELRRLRRQQQRQRIVPGVALRIVGMPARGRRIAMTDREQALRDGVAAARMAALVPPLAHALRRAPQPAQDRPQEHGRRRRRCRANSTNTGSDISARAPPHDSTTSPGWSATQAATRAAAAIRARNRMMRIMKFLLAGFASAAMASEANLREAASAASRASALSSQACAAARSAARERVQFAPRFVEIVAQRRRGDARDHAGAIGAGRIRALDAHELCRARLQAIDNAAAGGFGFRRPAAQASAR